MKYPADANGKTTAEPLRQVLREQLGLDLIASTESIEMFVVERVVAGDVQTITTSTLSTADLSWAEDARH